MSPGALAFMTLSWIGVFSLLSWSYLRILRVQRERQRVVSGDGVGGREGDDALASARGTAPAASIALDGVSPSRT